MVGPFGLRSHGTMSVRALPLARALVARGHAVTMLLPATQDPEDAGQSWEDAGVQIENLPLPAGVPGWFHLRLSRALARRALALHPDVVHVFKPKAYAGLAHWFLVHRSSAPHVVLDTDDWEGPGGWNDLNPYPEILKLFFTWQERWGLRHADAITVASRALQTLSWAQGGDPERVFYVPNGVEGGQSRAAASSGPRESGGRPTLLLYTRFFEYDLSRLWRVVAKVRATHPEVRLWVVGKGFFGEEETLLRLARDANWRVADALPPSPDDDLVYAGWVPPDALPAHFARATIALYPFDDTLVNRTKCPVKLLDLLAAGIPVVGESVGQVAETLTPYVTEETPMQAAETGILVPPGDEDAFVNAILALLEDDVRRRAVGARAAAAIRTRLSWINLAESVERAYRYAVGSKGEA